MKTNRFPFAPGVIEVQPESIRHWVARAVGWVIGLGFFAGVAGFVLGYWS